MADALHPDDLAAFLAAVRPPLRAGLSRWPPLKAALAERVHAAQRHFNTLEVEPRRYLEFLAQRLPPDAAPQDALAQLNAKDLYLACACAAGAPRALKVFESLYARVIHRAAVRLAGLGVSEDELLQSLRVRLFVGEAGHPPRITEYQGQGELRGWVKMALARRVVDLARSHEGRSGRRRTLEEALEQEVRPPRPSAESLLTGRQAERHFAAALREVLGALCAEDRNLLRQRYVHGLGIDAIAPVLGIHRATAARRLARLRAQLIAQTRGVLKQRLRLTDRSLDGLMKELLTGLDISLGRLLTGSGRS